MNVESLFQIIQDFRAQIEQWGITPTVLVAVAFLAGAMFILSLREVATWFLRVHTVRDELAALRNEIAELKTLITARPLVIEEEVSPANAATVKKKDAEKPAKAFRLDH